jgi:hypothetical protein
MKNKTGLLILHVTGCIAFLSLPVLLSPDVSWNFRFIKLPPFQEDFISYTLLLLFFYINYFLLVPRLYFKQQFILYASCVAVIYIVIALFPHIIVPGNHAGPPAFSAGSVPAPPMDRKDNKMQTDTGIHPPAGQYSGRPPEPLPDRRLDHTDTDGLVQAPVYNSRHGYPPPASHDPVFLSKPRFEYLFQFMMVLVLSAMIRINNRLKQIEKEKVNAELAYLKAQINPHFLFNTLNSIYSSAIEENADNTASAVVKLSGMMRYVISESQHLYVPLEKELDYISDYIELQKIRLGDTVHLDYSVSGDPARKQVAPLILISFIENAFKHGVNPEENSSIDIEIIIGGNMLQMSVLNNKVNTVNGNASGNNVGLENTTNRLKLLYPSKHELVIKEDEKEYSVLLKINLQ